MPNIKWLKKIEYETSDSGTATGKYPDIIDVGNEKFVVIQKSSSDDVVSTMQPGKKMCCYCPVFVIYKSFNNFFFIHIQASMSTSWRYRGQRSPTPACTIASSPTRLGSNTRTPTWKSSRAK